MATNITVHKQTVLQLLNSGQEIPFLIPEYQRPYSWSDDEIITLFDDLWSFSIERTRPDGPKSYFLGCVVSYEEDDKRQIIDGQQRITSLFLLLRAIFDMLEKEENRTEEVANFINKIKPALWKENEMTGREDRTQMLLKSDVVSDSGNEILRRILETGVASPDATDNYSKNYNKFMELYTEKSQNSPNQIFHFINSLLNYTILLPIEADDQETAQALTSGDASYADEMKKLAGSLASVNAMYEMQLQTSTSQLEATKAVEERIQSMMTNFADSAEGVLKYKDQVNALTRKVAELNNVYGNMLAAMQTKL